jgi:hypothetical protein
MRSTSTRRKAAVPALDLSHSSQIRCDRRRHIGSSSAKQFRWNNVLESNVVIIWTIIIGSIAGVIAKLVTPRTNEPSGVILTYPLGTWVRL